MKTCQYGAITAAPPGLFAVYCYGDMEGKASLTKRPIIALVACRHHYCQRDGEDCHHDEDNHERDAVVHVLVSGGIRDLVEPEDACDAVEYVGITDDYVNDESALRCEAQDIIDYRLKRDAPVEGGGNTHDRA